MTDEDGDASGSWLVDDEEDGHDRGAVERKPVLGDWSQSLLPSAIGPDLY